MIFHRVEKKLIQNFPLSARNSTAPNPKKDSQVKKIKGI
jgi:hypothetical protein